MANDFSSDPNCVALWKFDNNANDSKGGNDLTPVNSPTYESGDKKEGSYCLDLEKNDSQYAYRNDADLDAGFPGKSGTGEQSFSICFWIKPETVNSYGRIIAKSDNASSISWSVYHNNTGIVRLLIGYGGSNYTYISFGTALTAARWYHVGVSYDASTNGMKIRIWDDYNGQLLGSNATGSAGGDMVASADPLMVGRDNAATTYYYDGKIDEVVIFNKVLTDDEIDQIRAGTYGASVTEKDSSDSGSGVDAVESLQTPQAKTSSDAGSGIEAIIARLLADAESGSAAEASSLDTEGELENLFADEPGEGADRLVAKIEMPVKGGGMKLWT